MNKKIYDYWEQFLLETNRNKKTKCFEVFYFGHNEKTALNLVNLVLRGVKTATASSIYQYELTNSKYPKVGDLSIVTDFNGCPKCVIETKNVKF